MGSVGNRNFYTWFDCNYRDFMINILQNLEPIYHSKGTQIAGELDEFGEVLFVEKGLIYIGYEINKHRKFCVKY